MLSVITPPLRKTTLNALSFGSITAAALASSIISLNELVEADTAETASSLEEELPLGWHWNFQRTLSLLDPPRRHALHTYVATISSRDELVRMLRNLQTSLDPYQFVNELALPCRATLPRTAASTRQRSPEPHQAAMEKIQAMQKDEKFRHRRLRSLRSQFERMVEQELAELPTMDDYEVVLLKTMIHMATLCNGSANLLPPSRILFQTLKNCELSDLNQVYGSLKIEAISKALRFKHTPRQFSDSDESSRTNAHQIADALESDQSSRPGLLPPFFFSLLYANASGERVWVRGPKNNQE